MVVTPFYTIAGPVGMGHISRVSVIDEISDESDALEVECDSTTASIEQEITVDVLLGLAPAVWDAGSYRLQSVEEGPGRCHLLFTSAAFDDEWKKKRDTSYNKLTVKDLVGKIAKRHGLKPKCDIEKKITHIAQNEESDLNLLTRLAEKYNAIFNVKKGTLIFLNKAGDSLPRTVVASIEAERWTFRHDKKKLYKSCKARYRDHAAAKEKEVVVGDGEPQLVFTDQTFKSESEARDAAEAKLKRTNAKAHTASVTVQGRNIVAGSVATMVGFGPRNDGEYLVTRARHEISDVFRTTIELERRA